MTTGGPDHQGSLPGLSAQEAAALARRHGLDQVGVRPPLGRYCADLWRHRNFIWTMAQAGFISRHQNNYLGLVWSVLNPLLLGAAYFLIFGLLLGTRGQVDNFVAFLTAGLFTFIFISAGFNYASRALVDNTGLVRALRFPRAILPIAVMITELIATIPAFVMLLILAMATGEEPSLKWLLFPVSLLITGLVTLGIGLIAARIVHAARDVSNLVPLLTRMLRYISGIFFPIADFASGWIGAVLMYQPIAVCLTMVRESLLGEFPLNPTTWLVSLGWGLVLTAIGFVFFWRAEASYGRG
ncbi:ABC transporter permease [Ornithinimicrobium cavernae]|uniref:ABC transporter permease n=1 Tax=Ornithinimicrobium cavernae TaxID=2666047 RepID=UPI000D695E58|nr:ABC transporter permease [Ornithinimicrobium cavernae]